ncbi:MAG: polysaccharide biosynthesis/export family protein [Chitinophagaceae bacterium]|nr:polysaccharide biosynthesis/export family protein [Chitinophagaceae bacterium]
MKQNLCLLAVCAIAFLASCVSPEKLRKENVYFNEGLDSTKLSQYQLIEPVIQKGDLLQITISSRSSSSNQLFSQNYSAGSGTTSGGATGAGTSASGAGGYLVDIVTGEIKLPLLGVITADGMTKLQLEKEIIKRSMDYLKEDPIVNIRYLNFRVTFLGSVGAPGSKIFESERVSFLQALGDVGGIAPGGDLKNILLFREQNGTRTMHTIDLTNGNFLNSPNYYLKQNDVVYVSPSKRQLVAMDQTSAKTFQYVNFGFFAVNFIVTLISLIK